MNPDYVSTYINIKIIQRLSKGLDGFGGLVVSMLASGTRVREFKPGQVVGSFWHLKNPLHAFLRRGSERICPMYQLCGMSKNLVPP
jgi:hypothetical protein